MYKQIYHIKCYIKGLNKNYEIVAVIVADFLR